MAHHADTHPSYAPNPMNGILIASWIIATVMILGLLFAGRAILMPFAVAVVIWFLINALARSIYHQRLVPLRVGRWLSLVIAIIMIIAAFCGGIVLLANILAELSGAGDQYQEKLSQFLPEFLQILGVNNALTIEDLTGPIELGDIMRQVATSLGRIVGNAGLIILYVFFLLWEQDRFAPKLNALFAESARRMQINRILVRMRLRIQGYLWVKTLMSMLTGIASYVVLATVGLEYAAFWGLVIALMNYIPTIGSILGVLLPAALMLTENSILTTFLAVSSTLGLLQFLIGNVLEPRLMGAKLNLSPLGIILSLALWASLWGVIGAFLAVPMTAMAVIAFAEFDATRRIAIILSNAGDVD